METGAGEGFRPRKLWLRAMDHKLPATGIINVRHQIVFPLARSSYKILVTELFMSPSLVFGTSDRLIFARHYCTY